MMENIYIYPTGIILIGFSIYLFTKLFRKYSGGTPIINPFIFYDKVKNGYIMLSSSLYHNCSKKDLEEDLKNILRERADGRYFGGYSAGKNEFDFISFSLDSFYDLLQDSAKREKGMFLDLNKGVNLKELNKFFIDSLGNILEDKSFIRNNLRYSSFPYTTTLSQYQKILNKNSIKIGLFTDCSDSYYLFVFPLNKEKIVKKAISDIGFTYKAVPISEEKVVKPVISTYSRRKIALI